MDLISIGNRIRARREALHLTREHFSEKIGITPKFCADIETGTKGFSIKTLIKLSEVLGVTTDYILFGNTEDTEIRNIVRVLSDLDKSRLLYVEQILKILVDSYK